MEHLVFFSTFLPLFTQAHPETFLRPLFKMLITHLTKGVCMGGGGWSNATLREQMNIKVILQRIDQKMKKVKLLNICLSFKQSSIPNLSTRFRRKNVFLWIALLDILRWLVKVTCVYLGQGMHVPQGAWRIWGQLSFPSALQNAGPGTWIQLISLGCKYLCLLGHLAHPR